MAVRPSSSHPRRAMNRDALEQCLRDAKADLALVDKHISRQRQIIVDLEQSGQDARIARILLQEAEETRAVYVADAAWLAEQLEQQRAA